MRTFRLMPWLLSVSRCLLDDDIPHRLKPGFAWDRLSMFTFPLPQSLWFLTCVRLLCGMADLLHYNTKLRGVLRSISSILMESQWWTISFRYWSTCATSHVTVQCDKLLILQRYWEITNTFMFFSFRLTQGSISQAGLESAQWCSLKAGGASIVLCPFHLF